MSTDHDHLPVPTDRPTDQHGDPHGAVPARTDEAVTNPGIPEHTWRPTDVDPAAEKRAERQVALMFGLSAVCTVGFVVAYFGIRAGDNWATFGGLGASTLALGLTLGGALLLIGVGIIQLARKLMADAEISELRHPARSSDEDRKETVDALSAGLEESGLGRRPLIRNTMIGSVALLGAPLVVLLRDLGPTPGQTANAAEGTGLEHTVWGMPDHNEGMARMRVVRSTLGTPIRAADIQVGDLINGSASILFDVDEEGEPIFEGIPLQVAKSKAAVIVVRMEPEEIKAGAGRENWTVDGIICYSKICTHVGCPISLYERTTHHVLCPCHQSTFDLADSAKVIFGPAARPLPQLPLEVDEEGFLVAQSDFKEPVGPSYWERG